MSPLPRLFDRLGDDLATWSRNPVVFCRRRGSFRRGLLALFDQGADAVSALLADLLVEGSAALGLDCLAALLADGLVEAGAALRLDGVAALLADLLVEGAAALGLHRLPPLAADLLVERVAVLVAHGLPALAAGLAHAHRTLLLGRILFRHPPPSPASPCRSRFGVTCPPVLPVAAACAGSPCARPRSDRGRAGHPAFRSPDRTRPP